jgi:group II intron reverse transcriptase/maturase
MHAEAKDAVETQLGFIGQRAAKEQGVEFNNLIHQVNHDSLKANFYELGRNRAPGVDSVSWQEYESNLEANIDNLLERMKRMGYRPQPVKRVYIPKDNGSKRPLGLPTVEDKLVQRTMSKIMEAIYEIDFYEFSYGFRSKRSCHQALKRVGEIINFKPINHVIEADIKGFFDNVGHDRLMNLIGKRITDEKFLRYLVRFLKAGYVESGVLKEAKQGTPQGGNLSPLLANIFLHYVLDEWFEKELKPQLKGQCYIVRYCDDFVILVQYQNEAQLVMNQLQERFKEYGLELNAQKTRAISFGRYEHENALRQGRKSNTFDFLGFMHYCAVTRTGKFKVSRRTSAKSFRRSYKAIYNWLKAARNAISLKELLAQLKSKITGHYQYYGVSENYRRLEEYYYRVTGMLFKMLNRRCQKKSFDWEGFHGYLKRFPLPRPRIAHNFYA